MSLYNHRSSPEYRKHEVPQIVIPSSHDSDFKSPTPTRPPILQMHSGISALSASTAATSISASSIVEIKESIEEAMSTALFGEDFNTRKSHPSITNLHLTPTHPNPWSEDELLNSIREKHPPPLPPRPNPPTKINKPTIKPKESIVKVSLGSNAWETDSEEQTPDKNSSTKKRDGKSKNQNERCTKDKRKGEGKMEEVEDIEEAPEPGPETERMRNISFKKGVGQGACGLGMEGLKGMQNIQGPHHKGGYFKGMRGSGK